MSQWLEEKYIGMLGPRLQHFHKQSRTTWTFRCVFCGDSQRRKNKTRGYFFLYQRRYLYKCHNCNESMTLKTFLRKFDEPLYREYQLELLQERREAGLAEAPTTPSVEGEMFGRLRTKLNPVTLPSLAVLPEDHLAVRYAKGRQLPDAALSHLYFTDRWTLWIKELGWNYAIPEDSAPRLILPWFTRHRALVGFQARRIDVSGKDARYITLKANDDVDKIYGLDRLEYHKPIHICEGPLDSFFLPNCCAAMGSDLQRAYEQFLQGHKVTFVWDNEPRNRDLMTTMEPVVNAGLPVVIWPTSVHEKDLNDMARAGHDVPALVAAHTYSGLRAKLEFLRWRKS